MKVIIYPHLDPYYSAFYIYGLEQKYGKENISYSAAAFGEMPEDVWLVYLAFMTIDDRGQATRYVIDSNDYNTIKMGMYEWCDVYGHCNANFSLYPQNDYPKLVSLCPSFGIRCWSLTETVYHFIANMSKLKFRVPKLKQKAYRYYKQYRRLPYSAYLRKQEVVDNYMFFSSTLWYNNSHCNNDKGLNLIRATFIRAAKSVSKLRFEGGLVVRRRSRQQASKFADCLVEQSSVSDYLLHTQQSIAVFNTPAFWDCHGWKLGEYMALGKCIISTPLLNSLPSDNGKNNPLQHGKDYHLIEPTQNSMREAIEYIMSNSAYRKQLETNIHNYWLTYGTPEASLRLLGME